MPGPAWTRGPKQPQPAAFTGAMLRARHRAADAAVDHPSVDGMLSETPGVSWDDVAADLSASLPGTDLSQVEPSAAAVLVAVYLAGFRRGVDTLASAIAGAGE